MPNDSGSLSARDRRRPPAPALEGERLALLAAVIDTSSDAVVSKQLDGTVTSWNASAERIFGYTADEMVGQSIRRLIPDELQAEEDDILAKLQAGAFIEHYETVRMTKDGRRLDVSLSISPVKDETGAIVGAAKIARDITARKRAEAELAAATAKFETVFDQSGIFAGIMDPDGNLREINALAVDYCGYTREEVLNRPFWETPWWRGSTEMQEQIRIATRQAAEGTLFRETLRYWLADGSERIVDFAMHPIRDASGTVLFLHPTGLDITERTRAEEALRQLEAEEREIAVGLQRALLPSRLPRRPNLAFAARYEAGSDVLEVGGDWYDVFELPSGRVALTVGDVVGHGLAAAAAMGQLRTALVALAEYADGPSELLSRLDGFLARMHATDFATVAYAVLDPSSGELEYASAGHPPMLVVSPAGETRWLEDGRSGPLTGDVERARGQAVTTLEPGSLLVLYSDGLIERRREPLQDGLERLELAAAGLADADADEACNRLVAALGVESSREDDVVVLAVRLDPSAAPAFHRVFPAQPEELRELRAALRGWLDERDVSTATVHSLLLAVGEASANAIEHAYGAGEAGEVQVDVVDDAAGSLLVEVRDEGRFRSAASAADRGRGTDIMRALTTDFARETTKAGTTVRFRVPLEAEVAV